MSGQYIVSTKSNYMVVLPELIIDVMRRPHVHIRTHALVRPTFLAMVHDGRSEPASRIIIPTGHCLLGFAQRGQLSV
jgi:hypothetical protein